MAQSYGPKSITTDGLVFAIDADNSRCYPGTGTTIESLADMTNTQTGSMTDLTWVDKTGTAKGKSFYWNETSNEGMQINNTDQLATNSEMTVELWFNIEAPISQDMVLLVGDTGDSGVNIKFQLERIYLFNSDSTTGGVYNGSSFTGNVWQHVAICITGSATADQKFYNNGTLKTFLTNVNTGADFAKPTSDPIYIGKDHSGGNPFDGYISELRTYNRVLTESEILHNFEVQRDKYGV